MVTDPLMRDIRASAEVADMIGAENLDRLRHSPTAGPFTCWHCQARGDTNTEPATVIAELHDGVPEIALAHAECMRSQVVRPDAPAPATPSSLWIGAGTRTLTDQISGPDGPLPLLIIDQRPGLAVRNDPAEPADPVFAALLGRGLSPVTTISQPPAPAILTEPPTPAPGWHLELSGRRAARLSAPDGTIVYDGECGGQARPWRALITRTHRCALLIGAVGLYPTEKRPFAWIETLLDDAAHAEELVGGLVEADC
jgi:hypothetical protein